MPASDGKEPATLGAAVKTIVWSFFGVRRRAHHEAETVRVKPGHLIVAGIMAAALFVVVLVTLARFVVRSAGG
jgi:hypothetical protein